MGHVRNGEHEELLKNPTQAPARGPPATPEFSSNGVHIRKSTRGRLLLQ